MARTLTARLVESHLVEGEARPGEDVALRIDQTLTQDATGTLVMLELEAMGLDRVRTDLSVQYVDHNLIQADHKNADDHLFLLSACRRFGIAYSRPGNGVSHPLHQEHFGMPGATLIGSDSHTPAAGALGMLAFGAGGLDVALAMAGEPYRIRMPKVRGVELVGRLRPPVSAKDVILELLRRHGVEGGRGWILEYHGDGLASLSAMDRHVICNMGTELGATTSVFPADERVLEFLRQMQREDAFSDIRAEDGAEYDARERIVLDELEPLIAMPSSPGNVQRVRDVAGAPIQQSYIGSSANPGYRDFAAAALLVAGKQVHPRVSFDVNPSTRQVLENLTRDGRLMDLLRAGARLHQCGCNGCIGMGQAPATDGISLRTVPRNFPGRSGTREDRVCLVSPETAAASALTGEITDPRDVDHAALRELGEPAEPIVERSMFVMPESGDRSSEVELVKGPNIVSLPELEPLPDVLEAKVVLAVGDDVSTDEILPAGASVLPYRSNIPKIAEFAFRDVDADYVSRAREVGAHAIVGGRNYGQGSSREHAALAPRHLGLRLLLARSFARIHAQNLVNFGVLPLVVDDDEELPHVGRQLRIESPIEQLRRGRTIEVERGDGEEPLRCSHELSERQIEILENGGLLADVRQRLQG